jgi:hypothetical protein
LYDLLRNLDDLKVFECILPFHPLVIVPWRRKTYPSGGKRKRTGGLFSEEFHPVLVFDSGYE